MTPKGAGWRTFAGVLIPLYGINHIIPVPGARNKAAVKKERKYYNNHNNNSTGRDYKARSRDTGNSITIYSIRNIRKINYYSYFSKNS